MVVQSLLHRNPKFNAEIVGFLYLAVLFNAWSNNPFELVASDTEEECRMNEGRNQRKIEGMKERMNG